MIYLIDTDTLIYLIKNRPDSVAARVNALPPADRLCMSFVTYAELLKGAEKSTRKAEVAAREGVLIVPPPLGQGARPRHEHKPQRMRTE